MELQCTLYVYARLTDIFKKSIDILLSALAESVLS